MNERIKLEDTAQDMVVKMSDGNIGAMTALMEMLTQGSEIDPQAFGPFASFLTLDSIGIYGSGIYVLWNDKCNRDIRTMIMILRACQMGYISGNRLLEISNDQTRSMILTPEEIAELDEKVCAELTEFKKA